MNCENQRIPINVPPTMKNDFEEKKMKIKL